MEPDSPIKPSPFDVRTIKYLVRLMGRHDLTEIDLREGDLRIQLRRGAQGGVQPLLTMGPAAGPMQPPLTPGWQGGEKTGGATPATGQPAGAETGKKLIEIKSPTPGTFYRSSSPEAEPFIQVGSRVDKDTIVCIIEAMKVFNEIPAECSGTIVAILVENQQPVEYGQALFQVDPTG